jgi:hypothetical protein
LYLTQFYGLDFPASSLPTSHAGAFAQRARAGLFWAIEWNDERRGVYSARSISMFVLSGASVREACVKLIDRVQVDDELFGVEPFGYDAAVSNQFTKFGRAHAGILHGLTSCSPARLGGCLNGIGHGIFTIFLMEKRDAAMIADLLRCVMIGESSANVHAEPVRPWPGIPHFLSFFVVMQIRNIFA